MLGKHCWIPTICTWFTTTRSDNCFTSIFPSDFGALHFRMTLNSNYVKYLSQREFVLLCSIASSFINTILFMTSLQIKLSLWVQLLKHGHFLQHRPLTSIVNTAKSTNDKADCVKWPNHRREISLSLAHTLNCVLYTSDIYWGSLRGNSVLKDRWVRTEKAMKIIVADLRLTKCTVQQLQNNLLIPLFKWQI